MSNINGKTYKVPTNPELVTPPHEPQSLEQCFIWACDHVDGILGLGYAADHPELIAAYMTNATNHLIAKMQIEALKNEE